MKRRILAMLCVLSICVPLLQPVRAAESVCFTAIDDTLLIPLSSDSMPIWSGGVLYVPYTVFSSSTANGRMGLNSVYSRSSNTVSVYKLGQMMTFDLNAGVCYDPTTGRRYTHRAIIRNGSAYVPANQVCFFFELPLPTYLSTDYGYLLRFKTDSVVLSDSLFISYASEQMSSLLQDYNRGQQAQENPSPPQPTAPNLPQTPEPTAVPTYLSFRCETGQAGGSIAQALEQNNGVGLFFFPGDEIARQGGLIRRLLGSGHSVGILAEGGSPEQTRAILEEGSRALETVARTRTYYALVPPEQSAQLEAEGWVCWDADVNAVPDGSLSPYNHAAFVLRSLPKRGGACITMDDSQTTLEAMLQLFYQLQSNAYTISIPRETLL